MLLYFSLLPCYSLCLVVFPVIQLFNNVALDQDSSGCSSLHSLYSRPYLRTTLGWAPQDCHSRWVLLMYCWLFCLYITGFTYFLNISGWLQESDYGGPGLGPWSWTSLLHLRAQGWDILAPYRILTFKMTHTLTFGHPESLIFCCGQYDIMTMWKPWHPDYLTVWNPWKLENVTRCHPNTLTVTAWAWVLLVQVQYVSSGSTVGLECKISGLPSPPLSLYWKVTMRVSSQMCRHQKTRS